MMIQQTTHLAPVVVIEDCDEDFFVIQHGLQRHVADQPIVHFSESQTARQWLEQAQSTARLILLDLNLPGERGYSLLRTLKTHPQHKATPVIVLSSSRDPDEVAHCYRAGANSYHTKPLEVDRFYKTMQDIASYWLSSAYSGNV